MCDYCYTQHIAISDIVPVVVRFYLETMKAELPGAWAWFSPGDFVVHNPYLMTSDTGERIQYWYY